MDMQQIKKGGISLIKVNGTKTISNLVAVNEINNSDYLMLETSAGTRKVAGSVLKGSVFSPVATITQTSTGATISIRDKNGTTTADLSNGATGTAGVSPTATVTQTATGATISITDANGTTTANLTNGADGDPYVLTAADKADIVALVLAEYPAAEEVSF